MNVLETVRNSVVLAFRSLPMLLITFTAFLAFGLGNVGLIILLLGQVILVPITTMILHIFTGRFDKVMASDITQLVPSAPYESGEVNVTPSYWMMHVVYFMTYLFSNAAYLYNMPAERGADESRIENRKAKAASVMIVTLILTVFMVSMRYFMTNSIRGGVEFKAETIYGVFAALLFGIPLGVGVYKLAEFCGARHADVFGIVQQMGPVIDQKNQKAMTCVYAPKP